MTCICTKKKKEERQAGIVSIDMLFATVGVPQNDNFGVMYNERLANSPLR
jgi:hypothetical protein